MFLQQISLFMEIGTQTVAVANAKRTKKHTHTSIINPYMNS